MFVFPPSFLRIRLFFISILNPALYTGKRNAEEAFGPQREQDVAPPRKKMRTYTGFTSARTLFPLFRTFLHISFVSAIQLVCMAHNHSHICHRPVQVHLLLLDHLPLLLGLFICKYCSRISAITSLFCSSSSVPPKQKRIRIHRIPGKSLSSQTVQQKQHITWWHTFETGARRAGLFRCPTYHLCTHLELTQDGAEAHGRKPESKHQQNKFAYSESLSFFF
jgi:hypothetical protein